MPRLVTFGCSFTYGHGLPDCHVEPDLPGNAPSKHAWPNLLAKKLGYDCLNLSVCGSGNYQILLDILRTDFKPDDVVVIGYSYFTRFNYYQMIDKIGEGISASSVPAEHKRMLLNDLNVKYYDEKVYWSNWLAIQHAELLLNSKNIKNYSFLNIPGGAIENKPDLIELDNFLNTIRVIIKDKALDKKHPGIESHRLQSEQLYSIIAL